MANQLRIATRNSGFIDPESIESYIAVGGYQALGKCLAEMKPADVIELMKNSGLRGRGGAGFPTGVKWGFAAKYESDTKYVVCNADEGDPGAFMDRAVLEGDPHSVLEAMAIGGYAIGGNKGTIYIRAEYPLAIARLKMAIQQAKDMGLLGDNIMGTDFCFDLELKYGAGAFVCGEETALINSMEGNRGEWNKPTIVNNVETLANIPAIIMKGADWFNKIGTETSKGTKVFCICGKINNVGLIEVPMGTTLKEVIFETGGGIPGGKEFKAVQTGGPSGGALTYKDLDAPIDYENLIARQSMMGSGGMIVMDEDDCMVSVAKFFLDFTMDETCGKCTPCRIGSKRIYEILHKITDGLGTEADIEKLRSLSVNIKDTALCGLGQTMPNPVLSTMRVFEDEYRAHVIDKKCPAGVCSNLLEFVVVDEKCVGCTLCAKVCPVNCIAGKPKEVHVIDQAACIKCGACLDKCKFDAIIKQ
jgi:NADP-reducing hydrogenase subunit HndC